MEQVILGTVALFAVIRIFKTVTAHKKESRIKDRIFKLKMLQERNSQTYYFRDRLINEFGADIVKCMPIYNEMLYSDRPLVAKEWVNIDKILNLN